MFHGHNDMLTDQSVLLLNHVILSEVSFAEMMTGFLIVFPVHTSLELL